VGHCGAARVNPLAQNTGDSLVLASLNLHCGRTDDGRPFDVANACRSLQADVIVLQEAWRNDRHSPLDQFAKDHGSRLLRHELLRDTNLDALGVVLGADEENGGWGLAVLTSLPISDYRVIDLGMARGDMAPRAAQLVTLETPDGRRIRVVNTHLTYRVMRTPKQLRALTRMLKPGHVPSVIAGDLNMFGPVAAMTAGRRRAVIGRTWPARRPVTQLDHILIGPDIEILAGGVRAAVGPDHLPVRAQLRLG
jgi:endonuclease/exonuclease/phosphatase family metal-dependent hydrolase